MDKKQLRRIFRRVWRRNKLIGGGARPGVSIERIVNFSAKRSRAKNLPYFDLWNELYDEYVSWILSLLTVQYAELKKRRLKSRPYQFHRATSVLLFRVFSDLVAIRILCRAGFDVAAKSLTRSTIEHIDALVLIIHSPSIAKEFNKSDSKERSNAFWHKHISRGKVRKLSLEIWKSRLGEEFDADAWDDWLYNFHGVLGMSIHPSFSGGIFSALSLGSMSEDKWIGFLGDRADISADTFYHLIIHIWKIRMMFPGFPYQGSVPKRYETPYNRTQELHRHVKIGGDILTDMLVRIWDPKISKSFFREIDVTNIFPPRKLKRRKVARNRRPR